MPKPSLQLSKLRSTMARFSSCVSYGSDSIAQKRKQLYREAAKQRENGNFSRMVMRILDKELGIDLPLPTHPGRPKNKKKS